MIFDFFQIIDFKNPVINLSESISFSNLPYYADLRAKEHRLKLKQSEIIYLERDDNPGNYYNDNGLSFIIFGTVYSNNKYLQDKNVKPHKLVAEEIAGFHKEYKLNLTDYIKGSFVIVIYNDQSTDAIIISDRLNILPLYFYFRDGILLLSSSVKMIIKTGYCDESLDKIALTQQLLFEYTLGDHTYYKHVKRVLPGMIYTFSANELKKNKYWDVEKLYHDNLLPPQESLEILAEQLYQNVQLYTADKKKILVSLTGGFDGRTNLAMLRKKKEEYLCYSYGMPGSRQIEIPLEIAGKLDIPYKPIYCDEKFESKYVENARRVIEYSNGQAPFSQAVLPYAYSQLSEISDTILTGLFGSEVLRPLHNLGIIINDYSERIFLSNDPEKELITCLEELSNLNFLNKAMVNDSKSFILDYLRRHYFLRFQDYDPITRFFFFIIEEGMRKYFTQEVQAERVYVCNRFPYFDDDFVELIYKTTYAGMYNGFLGKSKFKRRKGQLLYAKIFNKYNPGLADIRLDRGYKPKDLLRPFPLNYLVIGKEVIKTKKYNKRKGNDTFNTPKWAARFINSVRNEIKPDENFEEGLRLFEPLENERLRLKYSHFLSIYSYVKNV